ncbi:hypothetical protein KKC17_01065 [Patescibacteria group bacterium]|nr:hypothetical protein [Patescibacteria group bacterium]
MNNKNIGAVITLVNTGKKIGPYFIGVSLEAIKKKFSNKIINNNFEIVEIDTIHIKNLPGYNKALEKINNGDSATIII